MQHSPTEIKEKLLKALDREYNVVDMEAVLEIITILERMPITKDALETTRLGKFINELRRKTKSESLAKRAKDLVRRWRELLVKNAEASPIVATGQQYNGANNTRTAPATGGSGGGGGGGGGGGRLSPGLPAHNRHQNRSAAISPAMSLPSSERSNPSPQQKSHSPVDPSAVCAPKQASGVDPVPKTHASNKRLRKGNSPSPEDPPKKVKRPNGLSADPTSCAGVNSHSIPSPDNSWNKTRGSFNSDEGSNSCELIETVAVSAPASVASVEVLVAPGQEPKKRGRKKGSKNKVKSQDVLLLSETSREDLVKEKMASMGRTPRVKTTQELLANLQAKSMPARNDVISSVVENKASLANCLLPRGRGGFREALEMSRNKTEHIAKFLRSQSDLDLSNQEFPTSRDASDDLSRDAHIIAREDPDASDAVSLPSRLSKDMRSPGGGSNSREELTVERSESIQEVRTLQSQSPGPVIGVDRTVEEILSRLPPLDLDAIVWEDSVSPPSSPGERHISEEDVKRLHSEHIEGLNGNINHGCPIAKSDGEQDDNFREWHQTVSRTSYQGELLHILPYVVID